MRCSNIQLIDKPVLTKDYHIYNIDQLPKVFLGINIKNKYDEARIQIKPKYKPKSISHFKLDTELEPVFLYGIEISVKSKYHKLLNKLNSNQCYSNTLCPKQQISKYKQLLSLFNLTCDACYGYLSNGIYPVDIIHLQDITKRKFIKEIDTGFKCMLDKTSVPWFMNFANFNIFILGKSIGYNVD